jgi:hypothetical protein
VVRCDGWQSSWVDDWSTAASNNDTDPITFWRKSGKFVIMKKRILTFLLILSAILIVPELAAQCPMCRATAETNLANGGTEGQGLNNGILYMLGMPYVVIGTIAFLWWRNRNKTIDQKATTVPSYHDEPSTN